MLHEVAHWRSKSIQVTDENVQRGFERVKLDHEQSSATQQVLLSDIKTGLDEYRQETQQAVLEIPSLKTGINYLQSIGCQLLTTVRKIWSMNILTYQTLLTVQSRLPAQLDRCWTQEPATLRDALGRVTPIHLDFLETWEVSTTHHC